MSGERRGSETDATSSDEGDARLGRRGGAVVLAAVLLAVASELLVEHRGHFEFEELFALHALLGFASAVGAAAIAAGAQAVLGREEDYYGD